MGVNKLSGAVSSTDDYYLYPIFKTNNRLVIYKNGLSLLFLSVIQIVLT